MPLEPTNGSSGYDIGPSENRGAGSSRANGSNVELGRTVSDFVLIQSSRNELVAGVLDEASRNVTLNTRANSMDPQFYEEAKRLETFTGTWDDQYHAQPVVLARNGFVYRGPGDRVKCVFCSNELWNWEPGDSVEGEHRRYYPSCPFVRGQCEDLNVPAVSPGLQNMKEHDRLHVKTPAENSFRSSVFSGRLQSFGRCQTQTSTQTFKPEDLANAGFFYVERENCIECFSCQIKVSNLMPDLDPWVQHARYSPTCPYVLSIKGRHYVNQVNQSTMWGDHFRLNSDSNTTGASRERIVSTGTTNKESVNNTGETRQFQQVQGPRTLIDDDLRIPAVLAVMQTFDISVEEMTRQLQQLRLSKGPGYTVTSQDFQDLLR